MKLACEYCGQWARLVTGKVIYPHRPDLARKHFWQCAPCGAWVGCHGETTTPLGRLANAALRAAKQRAHAAFDPIWQSRYMAKSAADPEYTRKMARGGRYKKLAELMGIRIRDCHIGMFSIEQCQRVVDICRDGGLSS